MSFSFADFTCPSETGFYRDEKDCFKFYECVNGIRHNLFCPRGSVFNTKKVMCDKPEHVPECTAQRVRKNRQTDEKMEMAHDSLTYTKLIRMDDFSTTGIDESKSGLKWK